MSSHLSDLFSDQGIQFVRVLWCDNANVIRGKAFHTHFLQEHEEQGVSLSVAQQAVPVMYDAVVPNSGLGPVGEAWLVPDWTTLNPLPYSPGHARVIGDIFYNGELWSCCPRVFLRRMIAAAEDLDLDIVAAFENEFYLLRSIGDEIVPVDRTVFAATLSMDENLAVINAIAQALIQQNIPVERYYPESGPGQHEISIRYTRALEAADRQIAFRETVRGVALRHGLRASFLPKIFPNAAGSGCHLHLSLWRDTRSLMADPSRPGQLSATAQAFMAGVLHHLPALMALTTPSVNSYRRIQPHCWSGAFRCWGMDNREAAIRVPTQPSSPSPTHLEFKTVDASANPYLALGAVIAAGLDGLRQRRPLPPPVTVDPGRLPAEERKARGIVRLPENLGDAIAHLAKDEVLLEALGPDLARAYLAVKQSEWEEMRGLDLDKEVRVLIERY
ncbi:MAG: glutamine synthetase family protein [Synechococcales bacterium]|nr:glutamine synthetase family protein [Synechococcales bacterium]